MKRVLLLVEGNTEESFVNRILSPFFMANNIYITPVIIMTKKVISGPDYKGGINSFNQVKRDLESLLKDKSVDLVSTMIDYYGLPADFPGYHQKPSGHCFERVQFMENEFRKAINNSKFLPYLQLHEFESLVFACPDNFGSVFIKKQKEVRLIKQICESFNSPEEINESPINSPSKRLKKIFPEYKKVVHSQLILENANISELRNKCSHFNSWITKIQSLAA